MFFFLLLVCFLIYYFEIFKFLTFENIQKNKEYFLSLVKAHYFLSITAYCFLYIIVSSLAIPGATILTLLGGFLFGFMHASLAVLISATIGATASFLLARYFFGSWIQNKYKDKFPKFNEEIQQNGAYYLLTLRLVPIFPFFLINVLAGLTNISLTTFILTTFFGIIPGTLVYVYAGSQLSLIKAVKDILSWRILFVLISLASLSLLPIFLKIKKPQK